MSTMYKKSFSDADEGKNTTKSSCVRCKTWRYECFKTHSGTRLEMVWICIKPVVGGDSCQAGHVGVITQRKLMCVHNDGTEVLAEAGDAYYFAPGHDGWVVGDETVIAYEIVGAGKDFWPVEDC